MRTSGLQKLVINAAIAALYAALTLAFSFMSYMPVQFRVSEALTVLPFFYPYTSFGLCVGCFFANLLGGASAFDILFGSLATLLAGFLTSKMKKKWQAPLPPILINAVVIGLVLALTLTDAGLSMFPLFALQIAAGQAFSIYALGLPLLHAIERLRLKKRPD